MKDLQEHQENLQEPLESKSAQVKEHAEAPSAHAPLALPSAKLLQKEQPPEEQDKANPPLSPTPLHTSEHTSEQVETKQDFDHIENHTNLSSLEFAKDRIETVQEHIKNVVQFPAQVLSKEMQERANNLKNSTLLKNIPTKVHPLNASKAQEVERPYSESPQKAMEQFLVHAKSRVEKGSQNPLEELQHAKQILSNTPSYAAKPSLAVYQKQLVETRTLLYYQQNLRLLKKEEAKDPEEKRRAVVKRVARELWTNFCVRGQQTHMLKYLHDALRKDYKEDFQFHYRPGSIELIILRPRQGLQKAENADFYGDSNFEEVSRAEHVDIVNKAWTLAQQLVDSYATE